MNFSCDFSFDDKPKNSQNVIALFNAASRNQIEKLNDIICKNASVPVTEDVNGFNCFHIAAKKGHIEIVKRIHSLYPDIVNTRTSDNQRSSLMLSAFEGHDNVVEYLSKFEVTSSVFHDGTFVVCMDILIFILALRSSALISVAWH